jgi:hypothetical protein
MKDEEAERTEGGVADPGYAPPGALVDNGLSAEFKTVTAFCLEYESIAMSSSHSFDRRAYIR